MPICQSAASAGHVAVVSFLLANGAKATSANSGGRTALHYAASKGRAEVARLLLQQHTQGRTHVNRADKVRNARLQQVPAMAASSPHQVERV